MLDRKALLNGGSFLPFEQVNVPELGGVVGLQGMTAGDALEFYRALGKSAKKFEDGLDVESLAKLIVRSVVDDLHQRIYTDEEWPEVLKWPHSAVQRVAIAAMRVNSGSVEGNSHATPDAGSSSDLPSRSDEPSRN